MFFVIKSMKLGSCESFLVIRLGEHLFGIVEPIASLMAIFFCSQICIKKHDFDLSKGFFLVK